MGAGPGSGLHPHKLLGKALPPKTSVGRQEEWGSLDQKSSAEEGNQVGGVGFGVNPKDPPSSPWCLGGWTDPSLVMSSLI